MFELEAPSQHKVEHDLWLAMQAAYNKYMETSATLDVAVAKPQRAIPFGEESLGIKTAARENRLAFESYIEARMQFAEFRSDRINAGRRGLAGSTADGDCTAIAHPNPPGRPWSGSISRLALPAAMVALLFTAAFNLAYTVREWRQIRDSGAARDQMSAMLNQTREDINALVRKLDVMNVTQKFAAKDSAPVRAKLVPPPRNPVTKTAGPAGWRRIQVPLSASQKLDHAGATHEKLIHQVQNVRESKRWAFTLPVSRRFQSVGPVRLSLRLVNLQYKHFDLCVMNDNFELQHVKLHEPVRITLSDRSRLELVATRIDKNYVQGYVSELKYRTPDLTASQVRRKTSGGT